MSKISCISSVKRNNDGSRPDPLPQAVFAAFCGDCSGSMESIKKASANGCYEWVKELTSSSINNNQDGNISVTFFDTEMYKRMENVQFKDVVLSQKEVNDWAKPRGMTKLYDSATSSVKNLHKQVVKYREKHTKNGIVPNVVGIFALNTDGEDNRSCLCNKNTLKSAIKEAREDGVKCFFLAANMNAEVVGESFGFNPRQSLTMDTNEDNAGIAFRSCTSEMLRTASTGQTRAIPENLRQSSCPSQFYAPSPSVTSPSASPSASPSHFPPSRLLSNRQRMYLRYNC